VSGRGGRRPGSSAGDGDLTDSGLATRASRGAAVTVLGQVMRIVVQAVGVTVLARLLEPDDFGLVAISVAIVGAGEIIRDFGLSMAAVQAATLTQGQRSNLFWLNSGIGIVTMCLVFLAAWPIGAAFGDQRIVLVTQTLSVTFLFNGVGSQFRAHLQRGLAFGWLALCEVAALSIGVTAGIVAAVAGSGYWAIVVQQLTQTLTAVSILLLAARWLPGRYRRQEPMGDLVRFGWHVMGYQFLTYASKNVDSLAIGAQFGPTPLGYYNRAFQLLTVPLNQLANPMIRVAVAVLSRLRDDQARYSQYLYAGQVSLMSFMLTLLVGLVAFAEPFVNILLGSGWSGTVHLFQILSIAGIFQIASYPILWAFMSEGLAKQNLQFSLIARPLLIVMVVSGSFVSVDAVAWAYAGGTALAWPLGLYWFSRSSTTPIARLAIHSVRSIATFGIAGCFAHYAVRWAGIESDLLQCVTGGLILLLVVALIGILVRPVRRDLLLTAHVVRKFRKVK